MSTRALSSELSSCPHAVCGWDACLVGVRVPALLCEILVPHWRRAPGPCSAGGLPWLIRTTPTRLFRVARLRLLTPAAVVAFADQVPRGQRVPLDQSRPLLIDRSAESVESFLPSRSRTWRRSREHQSPAHAADSSRGFHR